MMAIKYLKDVKKYILNIEYLGGVWNLTFAFTLNAERHFLFLNQMRCFAYQAMLRQGRAVIRKLIQDGEGWISTYKERTKAGSCSQGFRVGPWVKRVIRAIINSMSLWKMSIRLQFWRIFNLFIYVWHLLNQKKNPTRPNVIVCNI